MQVELARLDAEHVAGRARDDAVAAGFCTGKQRAQPRDLNLERTGASSESLAIAELGEQPVA